MTPETQYQLVNFETQEPIAIIVDEPSRRQLQKKQLKEGGLDETGFWVGFTIYEGPKPQSLGEVIHRVMEEQND